MGRYFSGKEIDAMHDMEDLLDTVFEQGENTFNDMAFCVKFQDTAIEVLKIAVSSVFLANHYESSNTLTTLLSFSILVFMKLLRSYSMAKKSKHSVRAFSAYMTEFTSFNALDPDEYSRPEIEMVNENADDLDIPIKMDD